MRMWTGIGASLLLAASAVSAAPSPPSEAQVRQLMEVFGVGRMLGQMNSQMAGMMQQQLPCVPASYWQNFIDANGTRELTERMVPIYQRHFSAADIDAHLDACDACRRWYEDAALITRLARVDAGPGAIGGIPDTVLEATPRPTRARLANALRVVLALLGAGQILLAIAQLAGPMGADNVALMHMTHEFTAWNAAIGASFLFIAWRRTRPAALLPLLTAFVGVLTVLSVDDIVHGDVSERWASSA